MKEREVRIPAVIAVVLLVGTVAPAPAASPLLENQGHVGAQVGYLKAAGADEGDYLVGGHLELGLLKIFGVRGSVGYQSDEEYRFEVEDTDLALDVKTIPLTLSARVYAPLPLNLSPYALGGGGWYRREFMFSEDAKTLFDLEDRTETSFGWHVGVGAVMALAPRIGVFAEYQAIFNDPQGELDEQTREAIENLEFDSSNIVAGVNLYF